MIISRSRTSLQYNNILDITKEMEYNYIWLNTNYGCELILRVTVLILNDNYPKAHIHGTLSSTS